MSFKLIVDTVATCYASIMLFYSFDIVAICTIPLVFTKRFLVPMEEGNLRGWSVSLYVTLFCFRLPLGVRPQ